MSEPLAYFLSWRTYGTWLHGDERGSVDDRHNIRNTPYLKPDPRRQEAVRRLMRWPPLTLSTGMRGVVSRAIEAHCRCRDWPVLALNVRTEHVHIVLVAPRIEPEPVMDQLKAAATRQLREAGLVDRIRKVWAEHGSTIWINEEDGIRRTADYVLNDQ